MVICYLMLVRYFVVGDLLPGWSSIVGTIILMGGVQLLSIGLIGEYLAHVFEEVKGRPPYLFKYTPDDAQHESQAPAFHDSAEGGPTVIQLRVQGGAQCA